MWRLLTFILKEMSSYRRVTIALFVVGIAFAPSISLRQQHLAMLTRWISERFVVESVDYDAFTLTVRYVSSADTVSEWQEAALSILAQSGIF
jgi:hypothetical protein